jgi:hypothetical protein
MKRNDKRAAIRRGLEVLSFLVVTFMLYVLSMGPLHVLIVKGKIDHRGSAYSFLTLYGAPLDELAEHSKTFSKFMNLYYEPFRQFAGE